MKRVFLGGTCNGSKWRDELIPLLKIDYFNPVVEDWDDDAQAEETRQKKLCDFNLFVITPKMTGVYAIAEVTECSIARPASTLFCVLDEDDGLEFTEGLSRSLDAVVKLIKGFGAKVFDNLVCIAEHLNKSYTEVTYNPNVIECTIKRDGPTSMYLGKAIYVFEKNEMGDYVCEVLSQEHRKHLLAIPEFNIYKIDTLAPKKEFTDEEEAFMGQWKHSAPNDYLAFVNGHIDEFNRQRHAVRILAAEKWRNQLFPQACPIERQLDRDAGSVKPDEPAPPAEQALETASHEEAVEMVEINKNPEDEMTAFDYDFWKKWKLMGGERFKDYMEKNDQQFLDAPEFLWDKARIKWTRLITDKGGDPWPFEEEE
ncbi:MAG: hypothetical protein IMF18_07990 [Proteobacteria bacterium]|nr:hypothetical protein [Pseudomonadota bacterium]